MFEKEVFMNDTQKEIIAIETIIRLLTSILDEDKKDAFIETIDKIIEDRLKNAKSQEEINITNDIFNKAKNLITKKPH
jgi:uncharacterized protein YwgA